MSSYIQWWTVAGNAGRKKPSQASKQHMTDFFDGLLSLEEE